MGMSDVDVPLPSYFPQETWKDNFIPMDNSHWSTKQLEDYIVAVLTGLDSFRPVYIFLYGPSEFTAKTWEDNRGNYFHFLEFIQRVRDIQPWHKVKDKPQTTANKDATPITNSVNIIFASRPESDLHNFHLPRKESETGSTKTVGVEAPMLRVRDMSSNDMKLLRFGMLKDTER